MTRKVTEVPLGGGGKIHRTMWEDDACPPEFQARRRYEFLRELVEQNLLTCGPAGFDTLTVFWGDGKWVVQMSAREEPV